jgi:hypothetical protein
VVDWRDLHCPHYPSEYRPGHPASPALPLPGEAKTRHQDHRYGSYVSQSKLDILVHTHPPICFEMKKKIIIISVIRDNQKKKKVSK